ncbi:YjgN family protein [Herbaspirillum rhizosphaerae]|uniref:YjgN family protein n=1 Tax=Herbaspirillum rhizosphaerae TaxID=346179 RepID=UPI00067A8D63|nr:YjgN family protein [Herbaspirillum rhizosphaerae]
MSDTFEQPGQPDFPASPDFSAPPAVEAFSFSGRGSEYFRIWIVNLLLSVVTLGIYSAWAKVRRLRYFYDNTTVAGTSFEYHGNPMAILKGRVITVVLLFGYQFAFKLNPLLGLLVLIAFLAAMPWLIWRSLQFKLYNTSYRGIRFGFRGNAAGAYKVYLWLPLLTFFTLYLLTPFTHQRIKRFQHTESRFGASHFSFTGSVGAFYKTYLIGFGIYLAGFIAILLTVGASAYPFMSDQSFGAGHVFSFVLVILALYAWTFLMYPLFLTLMQNLIWNHTRLGEHRFHSGMRWGRMMFIAFTNIIGIVCTLGLYTPFAQIRALRYRIESMSLHPAGSLDEFIADNEPSGSAMGEGMTDLLDFDLSL